MPNAVKISGGDADGVSAGLHKALGRVRQNLR